MAMQTINVEEGYMYTYVYIHIHVHLCIFMQTICIYVEESYMYIMHTCTFMYICVYSCRLHYFIYICGRGLYVYCVCSTLSDTAGMRFGGWLGSQRL